MNHESKDYSEFPDFFLEVWPSGFFRPVCLLTTMAGILMNLIAVADITFSKSL